MSAMREEDTRMLLSRNLMWLETEDDPIGDCLYNVDRQRRNLPAQSSFKGGQRGIASISSPSALNKTRSSL